VAIVSTDAQLCDLEGKVRALRQELLDAEQRACAEIDAVDPGNRQSARNLVHYVALRGRDIRELQASLTALGLSSLGRSEAHVMSTIEAVLAMLVRLNSSPPFEPRAPVAIDEGASILQCNAERLLGPHPAGRTTRIMVTLPSQATEGSFVSALVTHGMDVARINCAHDDEQAWALMIDHVRAAATDHGHSCRVAMDLAGPKLRTGEVRVGPQVVKIKPVRDHSGQVITPAQALLVPDGVPASIAESDDAMPRVPVVDVAWLARRRAGETIEMHDARRRRRRWDVTAIGDAGCVVECGRTSYVATGLELVAIDDSHDTTKVGELPRVDQALRVRLGDRISLTRSLEPAEPCNDGVHTIGCTLPEAFTQARGGQQVWLDDGKIGGTIDAVDADTIELTVNNVRPGGVNLRGGKGVNLPDTDLVLDALTDKDLIDLEFVARHADLVNVSFVRRPADVEDLQRELARLDAADLGVVLKIENAAAFEQLPQLLITAMRSPTVGVMIARGDLAIELGFERLAEVQEEIMWACEAAHVPVIWATQVLDTLARQGQPSRAEVTDAATAQRAECVMLNKGPHILEAITALDSILHRMKRHQSKKQSLPPSLLDRAGLPTGDRTTVAR
jgi:pyruvate kinase